MMLLRILAVLLCYGSVAFAEASDVPRLPDGKVDVAAVMSSFHAASPVIAGGKNTNEFAGKMLGKPFQATYVQTDTPDHYLLTIRSPDLSEEAVYLTAVLLTDMICLRKNRRPDELKWEETSTRDGPEWQVVSPCTTEPRLPSVSGS